MLQYANNATATLASPIGPGDTTLTLATGQGTLFPALTGSDSFYLTLLDQATRNTIEIVLVTARSGDTLTIERGVDGTIAHSYLAGDIASQRLTAAEIRDFASQSYGATFVGPLRAPTPTNGDSSTNVATTSWVKSQGFGGGVTSFNTRVGSITLANSDVTAALGFTPYSAANPAGYITAADIPATGGGSAGVSTFNTRSGAVTLTGADVSGALGFAPYPASNPNGYITAAQAGGVSTFNSRAGAVVLSAVDVSGALTYTPANKAGDTFSGQTTFGFNGPNGAIISGASTNCTALNILNSSTGNYSIAVAGSAFPAPAGSLAFYDNLANTTRGFIDSGGGLTWYGAQSLGGQLNVFGPSFLGITQVSNTTGGNYGGQFILANTSSGGLNKQKVFRINPTGGLELIDSAYANAIFGVSDTGDGFFKGTLVASSFVVSSSAAIKNIDGELSGADALKSVMSWLPKVYSLKADPKQRKQAGLVVEEAPESITDGEGHINVYAALTELARAFQHYVSTHP